VPHSDLIDSLIATYRELNLKLRPLGEDKLTASGSNGRSLRDVVAAMRNRELVASQQLKNMMLADVAGTTADVVDPMVFDPPSGLPTRSLLSEFGTAREAILAVVREMSEDAVQRELPSPQGPMTVESFLSNLVAQDKQDVQAIEQLLGARTT
jgi:hypothetical protein